jgi:L-rhamnose isomerase/sugar isomerase
VRPAIRGWRRAQGLAEDPLAAFRASGYLERVAKERAGRVSAGSSYA